VQIPESLRPADAEEGARGVHPQRVLLRGGKEPLGEEHLPEDMGRLGGLELAERQDRLLSYPRIGVLEHADQPRGGSAEPDLSEDKAQVPDEIPPGIGELFQDRRQRRHPDPYREGDHGPAPVCLLLHQQPVQEGVDRFFAERRQEGPAPFFLPAGKVPGKVEVDHLAEIHLLDHLSQFGAVFPGGLLLDQR
jgi:hypothetical protein